MESSRAVTKLGKTVVADRETGAFGGCAGEPVDEVDLESRHVAIDEDTKIPAGVDPTHNGLQLVATEIAETIGQKHQHVEFAQPQWIGRDISGVDSRRVGRDQSLAGEHGGTAIGGVDQRFDVHAVGEQEFFLRTGLLPGLAEGDDEGTPKWAGDPQRAFSERKDAGVADEKGPDVERAGRVELGVEWRQQCSKAGAGIGQDDFPSAEQSSQDTSALNDVDIQVPPGQPGAVPGQGPVDREWRSAPQILVPAIELDAQPRVDRFVFRIHARGHSCRPSGLLGNCGARQSVSQARQKSRREYQGQGEKALASHGGRA